MATSFSTLPIVDLQSLKPGSALPSDESELIRLSGQLYDVFATTGFAYLVNPPLSFSHQDVFGLSREFFSLSDSTKMSLAKKTFRPSNGNTYRGYFPTQPLNAADNLKEGFEMGPKRLSSSADTKSSVADTTKFNLAEPNVWPDKIEFPHRARLEQLYDELQSLSSTLLSLLAVSLGKPAEFFDHYLDDSISTLRLLHYPGDTTAATTTSDIDNRSSTSLDSVNTLGSTSSGGQQTRLSCTPHTDSGILTLLYQDSTGGLEVQNFAGEWIAAPYLEDSIVVNIGDLMAEVSGGRFVATMHRVRSPCTIQRDSTFPGAIDSTIINTNTDTNTNDSHDVIVAGDNNGRDGGGGDDGGDDESSGLGRLSVPFFFEPGEHCIVKNVDAHESEHGILYGEHVRRKMKGWVEFRNDDEDEEKEEER